MNSGEYSYVRYCFKCGTQMVFEKVIDKYDIHTGKPLYSYIGKCPQYKHRWWIFDNGHALETIKDYYEHGY